MLQTVNPALRQRGLIFHENWESTSKVISNGGVITSTPLTIPKRFTGNGSAYIDYSSNQVGIASKICGTQYLTYVIKKLVTPSSVTTYNAIVCSGTSTGNDYSAWVCYNLVSSNVRLQFMADSSNLGYYIVSNSQVLGDVCWVYDGTQSANATRLKLYVNGVVVTLSFSGTIPSTIPVSASKAFSIGKLGVGANIFSSGGSFGEIMLFNTALSAAEILSLYNNDFTFSNSGK